MKSSSAETRAREIHRVRANCSNSYVCSATGALCSLEAEQSSSVCPSKRALRPHEDEQPLLEAEVLALVEDLGLVPAHWITPSIRKIILSELKFERYKALERQFYASLDAMRLLCIPRYYRGMIKEGRSSDQFYRQMELFEDR